jgi:hypothetical protein
MTRAFFATGSALSERYPDVSRCVRAAYIQLDLNMSYMWINLFHRTFSITSWRKNQRTGVDNDKSWHHMILERHRTEELRDDD